MERTDLARITAFTDGVMAVAITLLVLNIEVPRVPDAELPGELADLVPSLLTYVLAFALVGRFWVIHHRLFEALRDFDGTLMGLNLAFLAAIVLMPFATELFDDYSDVPEAAAVFAGTIGLASLLHWLMGAHTRRRGHLERDPEGALGAGRPVGLGFAVLFFASIPVAFLSTTVAAVMWIGAVFLRYPLRTLAEASSR
jgi:uncharacterized membrane protein